MNLRFKYVITVCIITKVVCSVSGTLLYVVQSNDSETVPSSNLKLVPVPTTTTVLDTISFHSTDTSVHSLMIGRLENS
ncbi:uncharacterized protein HD556DRAFT_1355976 [Suillus plorans]|uniref:Uncharacterized protein n=1 Tax=Suillus plorans TaxID=116603 RepID=A0A9P7DLN8_9AGAM|nr:uncharacterized protein HD556DRAFT_1419204 [Suillus plorans]XP_041156380.1 uncharacterized protein HD556DRAFT_1398747 [Suillus plorans]XP_041157057.1 uncharacterized protein HD556DRAFT_1393935 [Suillus plorans]XP_041162856.1 uncharacterized protein HD556DRAFT_1355976 [Suillus plorans]KAG1785849.1 hypothetical protein HD556DRAFT_1419204 [Suillus plorans]KAG1789278.1 hypothetical protein HD556DRAFT_1398747 [Suillus plorans]KAG1790072.1 hypothetical protein HD556DRAFT_1393935 [Suillus plorans